MLSHPALICRNSILFVAGVDHNQLGNSSYISLSIYNAAEAAGIASSSQANVNAVGFNSGSFTTAQSDELRGICLEDAWLV